MAIPWVEDARHYKNINDLPAGGILKTSDVSDYLSRDNTRTIVMGPKGSGKTLLIKFKRKSLESKGYHLLPENQLVDVAPGNPLSFSDPQIDHIRSNREFWSLLWQIAIALTVVKSHRFERAQRFNAPISNVLENVYLRNPFQIFASLLHSTPQMFHAAVRDFHESLLPMFMTVHTPTAVFIDNIDEFFSLHLAHEGRHNVYGKMVREFWHEAQIGLLLAARALGGQTPHVKIYATIRIEAYNACKEELVDLANLRPYLLPLKFDKNDLKVIFEQNIRVEKADRKVEPAASDLMTSFFGSSNLKIRHAYTGKMEPIFDYVLRHTRARPRDLMTVGSAVSDIRPERRTASAIRSAVNDAAAEIGQSFIGESAPHSAWFDQDSMFSLISRNVLSPAHVAKMKMQYEERCAEATEWRGGCNGEAALGDLFRCGLFGAPMLGKPARDLEQHFESVYDAVGTLSRRNVLLPKADAYLVHPILGSYLRRRGDATFGMELDSLNIVSPGGPWVEDNGMRFVMQADVCGYARILEDPALKEAFPEFFMGVIRRARNGIAEFERVGGDGLLFADCSGFLIVRAAEQIAKELKESIFQADLRFGLDYGLMRFAEDPDTGSRTPKADIPLLRSARLQRASTPGHMLMPAHTHAALSAYEVDWPFKEACEDSGLPIGRNSKGWRLGKGDEELYAEKLYLLPLLEFEVE